MSTYKGENGSPPTPLSEPDSEEDLDLDELDPATASGTSQGFGHSARSNGYGFRNTSGGIALKNLKSRPSGRGWRRATGDRDLQDEEDLQGLLHDDISDDRHGQQGNSPYEEEDHLRPLRGRRRTQQDGGRLTALGSKMRLPSFSSSIHLPITPQPEITRDDAMEVEANPKDSRDVLIGQAQKRRYPANVVSNAKYTAWSFLPKTLYNEFSYFLNMYFLLVALSQILPFLRIGYMATYIVPLATVLSISIGKEALDDISRRRRDAEANSEPYTVVSLKDPLEGRGERSARRIGSRVNKSSNEPGTWDIMKQSRDLKVGDILKISKNQRLPADVVILKSIPNDVATFETDMSAIDTSSAVADGGATDGPSPDEQSNSGQASAAMTANTGETFIRTDQLDGETDWKLRLPVPLTQHLPAKAYVRAKISAGAPDRKVNDFVGTLELSPVSRPAYDPHVDRKHDSEDGAPAVGEGLDEDLTVKSVPLTIDNTAWANTVLASNTTTLAVIIYTGSQTRSAMSTSASRSKVGLLENEINNLTKILCALTLLLSIVLVALEGFQPNNQKPWYVAILMYLILFSTIIPIYARFIERDQGIPGTVVRTSTIPEDLGRIEYLLSDKTGTLTQNEMELKKVHVGTVSYANEAMEEVATYIRQLVSSTSSSDVLASTTLITPASGHGVQPTAGGGTRTRREIGSRVRDLILALALCHNVTPTMEDVDGQNMITYQASSPDEIAIVRYTEAVGLRLLHRDRQGMALQSVETGKIVVRVKILDVFPFTSDSKRMGIIVRFMTGDRSMKEQSDLESEVWFYQKGADTVMSSIVAANDWLDEETANMAREGLRTLVVGRRKLSENEYQGFSSEYKSASLALQNRDAGMSAVVKRHLEHDLELLGVTGVEDKLQKDVKPSLELLRNAGVKIWMLTGDKVETARCVAISSKLVSRGQYIHTIAKVRQRSAAQDALDFLRSKTDSALLIDGESLALMLSQFRTPFISLAVLLPAVIACRCSPTQKAEVAYLIRQHTHKRICCIGDGGNDVSMIQAADVGMGIVGKEGRQASLAADFSITQFCHLTKLLVWHGRNSYKRSAKLAQFIIHRGLIIAVCQTMYSIASHFDPEGLFIDWLLVGYATVYTMAPVFSLVFDRDVDENLANLYPELYKELKTGQSLSYKTFFTWVLVSIYQGSVIQGLSQLLVGQVKGPRMLSVSFTVLILNELIMVAVSVTTWHPIMIVCILGTAAIYAGSVPFLGGYYDLEYVTTLGWVWRVAAVAAISLVPVYGGKLINRTWRPPSYRKVQGI